MRARDHVPLVHRHVRPVHGLDRFPGRDASQLVSLAFVVRDDDATPAHVLARLDPSGASEDGALLGLRGEADRRGARVLPEQRARRELDARAVRERGEVGLVEVSEGPHVLRPQALEDLEHLLPGFVRRQVRADLHAPVAVEHEHVTRAVFVDKAKRLRGRTAKRKRRSVARRGA